MRRFLLLLVSVALLAAACAGDESETSSPPTTATIESAVTEPTPPPEPAPETPPSPEPPPPAAEPPPPPEPSTEPPPAPEPVAQEPREDTAEEEEPAVEEETAEKATPLPVDPEVLIGTLENGLTYYIRNNEKPGSNLSLRLVVNAGSVNEPEPGLGVAHFLEHMMFNGTEAYPGNEIVDMLRELGVEFGPDINAHTSYDSTVYELDVSTTKSGAVEAAFEVLSQWANAATITETDVLEERGVVRDELRVRYETGDGIINSVFDKAYVEGTPYDGYHPIGTAEAIEAMTAETLRDFYETWYVPANMALVAVGDLPVDDLELMVEERFGDIPAAEAPSQPDVYSPINQGAVYRLATSPSQGYSYMSLDLKIPSWDGGTAEGQRSRLIESLLALVLETRLNDAYEQGFLSQLDQAKWDSFSYTEGIRFFGTNLRADDLTTALGDYWSMVLSLAAAGFTAEDLQYAAELVQTELQAELDSLGTVQDRQWADLYASHFVYGYDIDTVAGRAARVDALLQEVQPEELTEYFRSVLRAAAPIVIAVGAEAAEVPTVAELRAAIEGAEPGPVPERTAKATALMEAPEPVDAVAEGPVEAIDDAYEWTFANGASVVFVPSEIAEAEVNMLAFSQGGWSAMEPGERSLTGRLAIRAVVNSGLGDLSPSQVKRLLDDQNVSVAPFIGEAEEGFAGSATAEGIERMFQMMHLLVTAPQVDDQAFAEALQVGNILLAVAESAPEWMTWIAYEQARHPDSFGWFNPVPSAEALAALTPTTLLDRYRQRLGDVDDLVVAVAGDVERDTVAELAHRYVGTLPAGESDTFANRRSAEPDGVVQRQVILPPDSQTTGLELYFEAPRPQVDVALKVAADALTTILNARLVAQVREEIGASYITGSSIAPVFTPEPRVVGQVVVSGDPQYIEQIQTTIFEILDDLGANGPTEEEWAEALALLVGEYTYVSNSDFLTAVRWRAYSGDEELPTSKRLFEEVANLQASDVKALAAELFDLDQHIDIITVLE